MEPSAAAWLPVAVFFARRGHTVYRVPVSKAADLRRFLSRHAKSNRIDADALARLPLVDPGGLTVLELPDADRAALDRRVRACDRLTEQIAAHKVRIRHLALQLMPTFSTVITNKLSLCDLAVLERYADPRALLQFGEQRLCALITKTSKGRHGAPRAQAWMHAAQEAVAVYGDDPAVAFADIAAEIATEVRLLRAALAERPAHEQAREDAYQAVDPTALTRSLPGVAKIGGPVLTAALGRAGRFRNAAAFKSFTGLAPKANHTGDVDRKGSRSARRARRGCAISSPPRRTPPAGWTPSSPPSTTSRSLSAARTTRRRSAWSPPVSPSACGPSIPAVSRTSSATSTAPPSPHSVPARSSPSATRSPTPSEPDDAPELHSRQAPAPSLLQPETQHVESALQALDASSTEAGESLQTEGLTTGHA